MTATNPATHPPEVTRAALASLPKRHRCDASCPGWILSESDSSSVRRAGLKIERCDECAAARTRHVKGALAVVYDEDVRVLPEARAALRKEYRRLAKERDLGMDALRKESRERRAFAPEVYA